MQVIIRKIRKITVIIGKRVTQQNVIWNRYKLRTCTSNAQNHINWPYVRINLVLFKQCKYSANNKNTTMNAVSAIVIRY